MSVFVEIPDPLATQVAAVAKSRATSLEHYVIEAVTKTVAEETSPPRVTAEDPKADAVLGAFADDADLLDAIVEQAMHFRRTAPMRTPDE